MSTILKWAGNKTAIMSELKKHLPAGPRLVEPFAGSCAVMMETDQPTRALAPLGLVAITVPLLKICTNKGKTNQLMEIPERISPVWMPRSSTITCTV